MPPLLDDLRTPQYNFLRMMREDSRLDPRIPLAGRPAPKPEFGLTVEQYYIIKHTSGPGPGRFYQLHTLALKGNCYADK